MNRRITLFDEVQVVFLFSDYSSFLDSLNCETKSRVDVMLFRKNDSLFCPLHKKINESREIRSQGKQNSQVFRKDSLLFRIRFSFSLFSMHTRRSFPFFFFPKKKFRISLKNELEIFWLGSTNWHVLMKC
jgi:hypothetical protein